MRWPWSKQPTIAQTTSTTTTNPGCGHLSNHQKGSIMGTPEAPQGEVTRSIDTLHTSIMQEKTRLDASKAALTEQLIGIENQLYLIDRLLHPDKYKPAPPEPKPEPDPMGII